MGATAPYFRVYPLPANVPTNAGVLASQHMNWTVTVLDGKTPIEVRGEPFAEGRSLAIRPAHGGWPPNRTLEIVARLGDQTERHPFHTASTPHDVPPLCAWNGSVLVNPRIATPQPDIWPTNMPRPPANQRTFSLPDVVSPAGFLVAAQLHAMDRGRRWTVEVSLTAAAAPTAPGPPDSIALAPPYGDEFSDGAQIVGMVLTDAAGNVARYGST